MKQIFLVILGIVAFFHYGSHAKQFEHWYPFYQKSLTIMEDTTKCHETYADQVNTWGASDPNVCKTMVNCLMTNNGDINKADWASALVLLGLTPTILGQLGSGIKEKSQLSFRSPVLGFLCLLGAPSTQFGRPWAKEEKTCACTKKNSPGTMEAKEKGFACREKKVFDFCSRFRSQEIDVSTTSMILVVLKYLLAATATVNVLHNVITLGQQTIVSWKCTWSHLELAWIFTAIIPILVAIVPEFLESRKSPDQVSDPPAGTRKYNVPRIFYSISNILCAVHVVFGTLMLSSVMFIGTLDALGVVGRFTASTLVCQMITALELDDGNE